MSKIKNLCKIYLLTNKINGMIYVGQTWYDLHIRMGKDGSNYKNSIYLYNAIKKYGVENFEYTLLIEVGTQEEADKLEMENIKKYNSNNLEIGYNLKEGGWGGKHSEETKRKISESISNKEWSDEAIESRKAAGRQWKGKKRGPHTEEWKENNSKFMKKWHSENESPMKGRRHTEESLQKMQITRKNNKEKLANEKTEKIAARTEKVRETKKNSELDKQIIEMYLRGDTVRNITKELGIGNGKVYRALERNNIDKNHTRNTWEGKTHSEETKEKMSIAAKKKWNK